MKYSDKLRERYAQEIASWDWDAFDNPENGHIYVDECGDVCARHWLGEITAIYPSGKIYAPWTANQTVRDMIKDRAFAEALEAAAEDSGFYLDHGESVALVQCLDPSGEFFYVTEDGFARAGEHVADDETALCALMESEGYFPNVYWLDGRGDIGGFYQFETVEA